MVVLVLAVLVVVLHFTYYSTTDAGPTGRSHAGIAGPNPARGHACLLWVLCAVR